MRRPKSSFMMCSPKLQTVHTVWLHMCKLTHRNGKFCACRYLLVVGMAGAVFMAFSIIGCAGESRSDGAGNDGRYGRKAPSVLAGKAGVNQSGRYGIVYVRVPRSDKILHLTKAEGQRFHRAKAGDALDPSFMDNLPGVTHVFSGFNAPGQLVWQRRDGSQVIIFDCVNGMPDEDVLPPQHNGDDVCVPMDPMVSFDGTKVAFAVYHGSASRTRNIRKSIAAASGQTWRMAKGTWAGIYIYDFETGDLTHWPHHSSVWDTAPVWLPNGKMMFTSTRAGVYARHSIPHQSTRPILQLWIANQDGSGARNIGTQQQDEVLHPYVLANGRVLFTIHELPFARFWDRHGVVDGAGNATIDNVWWLESVDLRGGNLIGHMGTHDFAHVMFRNNGREVYKTGIEATHFLGQLSNGDICTDVYYRGDNMGGGMIVCWPAKNTTRPPDGHEGAFPFGLPAGAYIALWGEHSDYFGKKIRDPAGLPDGQILFSAALGVCHWIANKGDMKQIRRYMHQGQTCDLGIYAKQPLRPGFNPNHDSTHYDRAVELVNSPHWHEFMPKPVLPYQAIYGIAKPEQPGLVQAADANASYGIFGSVNVAKGNVRAQHGWNGPADGRWCHYQGCALQASVFLTHQAGNDYDSLHQIKAMRFWKVIPLRHPIYAGRASNGKGKSLANLWGQRMILMGDVPVRSDGSFKAKLPADVPFVMAGVDAQGRAIARHQHVMAMRPGEKQVCQGCHLHATTRAENARYPFSDTMAATRPAVEPTLQWPHENREPEWRADIYPMLRKNCSSCHSGSHGAPRPDFSEDEHQLYEDLTNYYGGRHSAYPVGHPKTGDGSAAATPWLTRYVNGLYARESLLYWKAAGKRLDGRKDGDLDNDFDFGPSHVSYLTDAQLRLLSDWMEGGFYCDTTAGRCGTKP